VMIRVQILVGILLAIMLVFVISMVRKEKIDLRYALPWILLCLVIGVIDLFPETLEWLARKCGMHVPSNMVFLVAIVLLSLRVFLLTASVSRLSRKNTRLTQEIALLRGEVEEMRAERGGSGSDEKMRETGSTQTDMSENNGVS